MDHTPEFVINDYHHCGPRFENYPQASEYKITVSNDSSFRVNRKLSTVMFEQNLVDLQPVIEVSNIENVVQCFAPEALTYGNHQGGPRFEYYPQVTQCNLSVGRNESFLSNDNLFT